ncbi:MAG: 3-mercaptopyruvate sulfurtransferase [Gemmatimonadales bacterium]
MSGELPTPIVATAWLAAHLGEPDLVVVDASWYLPAMQRDARAEHLAGHIPGAVFWDLDALSDQHTALPHMLPDPDTLARSIGGLGMGSGDRVVVYDGSGANLSAARVWWTLRVAGHDAVTVLDGGLVRWRAEGRPLESGPVERQPARFRVRWRPELVRSLSEVREAIETGTILVVDARSRGRFAGTEPEPRPGLRGGHLPGARNLPFAELVDAGGRLLSKEELAKRFTEAGVDLSRPIVTSCGSGVTACALALGLHVLGHRDYAVYDGSWSEWGRVGGPPIE